jgi:diadenosine tetraphosphate (Ap4A) HIT family hydrolase
VNTKCYKCPEDWRFHHSVGIKKFLGPSHPIAVKIQEAESIYEIPLRLRKLYKNSNFLYKDEQFVIVQDPFPDFETHLLIIPIEHIESTDILNYPDLLKDMVLAGWFIVDKTSSTDELSLKLSCKSVKHKNNYFKHFHLHIQSDDLIDEGELIKLFTPKFYKGHTPNG